jgi:hypothetical protein
MLLSSKRTDLAEVLIPAPFDQFNVLLHYFSQFTQSARVKTIAISHPDHGGKPELSLAALATHMYMYMYMYMQRLARITLVRVKEKTETFVAEYGWHGLTIMQMGRLYHSPATIA